MPGKGRPFKKGNQEGKKSAGGGRPRIPVEVLEAYDYGQNELIISIIKYFKCTPTQLRDAKNNPNTPVIDHIVIQILIKAAQLGDAARLNFLMEQIRGKLPNTLNLESKTFHSKMLDKLEQFKEVENT